MYCFKKEGRLIRPKEFLRNATVIKDKEKKKKPFTYTLQHSEILFLHISQLVRKLGSECRVSHGTTPLEQGGLKVLLKGPTWQLGGAGAGV